MSSAAVVVDTLRVKCRDLNILLTPRPPPMLWEVLLYIRTREITNSCQLANSVDPDEATHEPSHLYLHCLPSSL